MPNDKRKVGITACRKGRAENALWMLLVVRMDAVAKQQK